ncbi:hypothetical protein Leryth_018741 [Lithospermum erythrorhizon]|nr:hypothetical protein Leryth_018741 [Lithospermum erythrorhizon]
MAKRGTYTGVLTFLAISLCLIPIAYSDDATPIPENKAQVASWFQENVKPLSARQGALDPALEAAESNVTIIKMRSDGSGDFKTINEAIQSIATNNMKRVIISLAGGIYKEKIKIDRTKPFVTFFGDAKDMPVLDFNGDAKQFGTVDSATLIVESDYFNAIHLKIIDTLDSAIKVNGGEGQALRIGGDKASFYNCKLIGFQDTLCDDKGRHFFKDCYIEGTVDFIFGSGKSICYNTELHVIPGDSMAMITAQAGGTKEEDEGFSIVHCTVTGSGGIAYLGRAWMAYPKVTFSFTEMSDVVNKEGWSNNKNSNNDK